jgi:hypothetical protein
MWQDYALPNEGYWQNVTDPTLVRCFVAGTLLKTFELNVEGDLKRVPTSDIVLNHLSLAIDHMFVGRVQVMPPKKDDKGKVQTDADTSFMPVKQMLEPYIGRTHALIGEAHWKIVVEAYLALQYVVTEEYARIKSEEPLGPPPSSPSLVNPVSSHAMEALQRPLSVYGRDGEAVEIGGKSLDATKPGEARYTVFLRQQMRQLFGWLTSAGLFYEKSPTVPLDLSKALMSSRHEAIVNFLKDLNEDGGPKIKLDKLNFNDN